MRVDADAHARESAQASGEHRGPDAVEPEVERFAVGMPAGVLAPSRDDGHTRALEVVRGLEHELLEALGQFVRLAVSRRDAFEVAARLLVDLARARVKPHGCGDAGRRAL